jgi:mannitol-specific phosphotransferase system IIBC component
MLAGVTRRKHWEIQEDEAVSIAKPASNMIQKLTSKQKQKINQLAAPIMLVSAIASVVVPRLIIDMAMAKETNQNERVKKQVSQNLNGDAKQNVDESGNVGIVQTNSNDSTSVSTTVDSEIAGLFSRMD